MSGQSPRPKSVAFFADPAKRGLVFQGLALIAVLALVISMAQNAAQNLTDRGIASGFGFLSQRAGFSIVQTLIPYSEESRYLDTFYVGLLNTLLVSALSIFFGTIIGLIVGLARLSSNFLINRLALIYVEALRNIPLLLLILIVYFMGLRPLPGPRQSLGLGDIIFLNNRGLFLPLPVFDSGAGILALVSVLALIGALILYRALQARRIVHGRTSGPLTALVAMCGLAPLVAFLLLGEPVHFDVPKLGGFNFTGGLEVIPELLAMVVALSLFSAAFIAEIVRSGIQSVSHGQLEAAAALGLKRGLQLRLVALPQALRVMMPPVTSEYLNILKNSSLSAAIAYPDLVQVFAGTTLNQTGQAVEIIAITMAFYLTVSTLVSSGMAWVQHRRDRREANR